jgi:hypothetical protein
MEFGSPELPYRRSFWLACCLTNRGMRTFWALSDSSDGAIGSDIVELVVMNVAWTAFMG